MIACALVDKCIYWQGISDVDHISFGQSGILLNCLGENRWSWWVDTIWEYKLRRCSKNECCEQCRHVKFKGTMTKWPVQKQTHRTAQKHAKHQDATDIQKKLVFVYFSDFIFCIYDCVNNFTKKCWVAAFVRACHALVIHLHCINWKLFFKWTMLFFVHLICVLVLNERILYISKWINVTKQKSILLHNKIQPDSVSNAKQHHVS